MCLERQIVTARRMRGMREGNSFTLLVCPQGGGVPQSTYPPAKVPTPPARSGWEGGGTPRYLPHDQGTYPPPRPGQDGRGYPKVPTPIHGTYPPSPPPGQGLPRRQAVCLLRSRRRTFLFLYVNDPKAKCIHIIMETYMEMNSRYMQYGSFKLSNCPTGKSSLHYAISANRHK